MLFEGEKIEIVNAAENGPTLTDKELDEKYLRGEVRIVTEQARYPLSTIPSLMGESDSYQFNPEYQRRQRWDDVKRSKLIESFIMNVPVPPIFLYENDYSAYEVMDGLQRLTTIVKFYNDEFALQGLGEWKELNGKKYSELPNLVRKGIDRRYMSSIILLQETAKTKEEELRLKQMVFERINSGGVKLSHQESRNAIYDGPLNKLCMRLSKNEDFTSLWKIEVDYSDPSKEYQDDIFYREMRDVELVLRFFAQRQGRELQKNNLEYLKDYLDYYLKNGNLFSKKVISALEELFVETIHLAKELFSEKAFWLYKKRRGELSWYDRPTVVVYDPMMYALSQYVGQKKMLVAKKDEIQSEVMNFYAKNEKIFEGRTTTRGMQTKRENAFLKFFAGFV